MWDSGADYPCRGGIQTDFACSNSVLDIGQANFTTCKEVRFSWAYPTNNLTITIGTQYTYQRKPFTLYLDNKRRHQVYRVHDGGQETDITSIDEVIIQYSDINYQVILKFQEDENIGPYLTYISYRVAPQ
ncbi:unnamed protein product [Didymodactylos carnosus]|uniref:Uncharacterized protein n=1 Tax=Didymodactylos carnosus TaxID=1234261 RepID=A0A8S2GYP0_9BILA|nr:unnamed protein product [Didymodactylos carnosus]CAF3577982.1 unnamed protein product [Didymodactylos carnosus]